MNNKMLSNEQIADYLLEDMQAYKENVKEIIISRLMDSTNTKTYWDAWFRGADGKDLEDADNGKIYQKKDGDLHASDAIDSTTDSDWFWEDKDKDVSQYMDVSFVKIEITNYARNNDLDPNKNADWITLQNYANTLLSDLYNECIWNVWGTHQKDKCENLLMNILKNKFESVPENLEEINDFIYDYIVDGCQPIGWGEIHVRKALAVYVKVK